MRYAFLITLAFMLTMSASAQSKLGIVNTEVILKELPEAIEAGRKLDDLASRAQDTLRLMQQDFQQRLEQYQKQSAMMAADAKRKEEESLNNLRLRILQYQDDKLGNTGELVRERDNLLKPIREKVQSAISVVAKEEKLNLVLDKVGGLVLYSEDKSDITYKVLDKLKRGDK